MRYFRGVVKLVLNNIELLECTKKEKKISIMSLHSSYEDSVDLVKIFQKKYFIEYFIQ